MWRNDWDRLGPLVETLADGAEVVVSGGCDYYPGSASASPCVQLLGLGAPRRRRGRPARADRAAPPRAGGRRPARAPARAPPAAAAAHDRRDLRRKRQGARGRARRTGAARLGGSRRVGLHARPGSSRRAADRRRAARARSERRGRGDRRRPRRRLADRPARLLRRAAVPHGGAAADTGDRVDRPSHRPHAARRGGGGQLLDADPRRRGCHAAELPRRAPGAARLGAAAARPRPRQRDLARPPAQRALARAGGAPGAPPPRRCTRVCANCGPPRDGSSPTSARERCAARRRSPGCATERSATARSVVRPSSSACASRSAPTTRSARWPEATRSSRTPTANR